MSLALLGTIIFLVYEFVYPGNYIPILEKFHAEYVIFMITVILAIISGKRPSKSIQAILIIFILVISLISSFTSPIPVSEENFIAFTYFLKSIAIFLLVSTVIESKKEFQIFLYCTIFISFIVGIVSLITLKTNIPPLVGSMGSFYVGRVQNFFGGYGKDPNDFGALYILLFSLPLCIMQSHKSFLKKLFLVFISLTFLYCIVVTQSRGTLVGFFFSLIYLIWENRKRVKLIILILLITALAGVFAPPEFWERASALRSVEEVEVDSTAASRLNEIQYSLELIKLFPLTGVGIGNYIEGKLRFLGLGWAGTRHVAHNSYLHLGAEIGLPGLIIYLIVFYVSLRNFFYCEKIFKSNEDLSHMFSMVKGMKIGYVGFLIAILFISKQYDLLLFMWVGLAVIAKKIALEEYDNTHSKIVSENKSS